MVRVTALAVHPVKSCRGVWTDAAEVGPRGFVGDRGWMVVDADGTFLSQRTQPGLAQVDAALDGGRLRLAAAGHGSITVDPTSSGRRRRVTIWGDTVDAESAGPEAAAWFSELLGVPCDLVRMPEETVRPVDPGRVGAGHRVGFADGYPFLLLSEASLADLNRRLDAPVPIDRFRPNIVVGGCGPFDEDGWRTVEIGGVGFRVVKPCTRCVVVTTDQRTGVRSAEPLRTLATYRRADDGVRFGQNLVHLATGTVRVGDPVTVADRPG